MSLNEQQVKQLVSSPTESLSKELKDWFEPATPQGIEKIVKTCIAMRNNDGGYLLIGFNNITGLPNKDDAPNNTEELFHMDKIQDYITKYSSEAFEISLYYPVIDNNKFVLIEIQPGVKTPIATKSGLNRDGTDYIKMDKVYIRTLNSNNTPSTSEAKWKDWLTILHNCFENREADIGRFLRRHLSNISSDDIDGLSKSILANQNNSFQHKREQFHSYLNESKTRFNTIVKERELVMPDHGEMEIAAMIKGDIPEYSTNQAFLNLLSSVNPQYTGWPLWVDSRSFEEKSKPFVFNNHWEALIANLNIDEARNIDFWRISPKGKFYCLRALEDDISWSNRNPKPLTAIDYGLVVLRAAEGILVCLAFAKALEVEESSTILFEYRWTCLNGRVLSAWANPERLIFQGRKAYQDEVVANIELPIDTPKSAIASYVHKLVSNVFAVFEGTQFSERTISDLIQKLVERK